MRPFDGGPGRKVEVCDRKYTDKRTDWIVFRYLCINASPMIRLCRMLSVVVCLCLSLSRTNAQDFDYSKQIDRAVRLMDAGLLTESEELLRSVLAAESRNYAATYELGYLRYLQEDYRVRENRIGHFGLARGTGCGLSAFGKRLR